MHLKNIPACTLALALASEFSSAYAAPVTFDVRVNVTRTYDYASAAYVGSPKLNGALSFSFDDAGFPRNCIPSSCPNQILFPDGRVISSLSAFVPPSYGSGSGSPLVIFAPEFETSDYLGLFDWASGGTTIFDASAGLYRTHVIYASVLKRSSNLSAYGTAEEFLQAAMADPAGFKVFAGEAWYASPDASPFAGGQVEGFDWRDEDALILRVNDLRISDQYVPEPSSLLLAMLGMVAALARPGRRVLASRGRWSLGWWLRFSDLRPCASVLCQGRA